MIPIYEQGHGRGIGLNLDRFIDRLGDIHNEHVKTGRAKAIAIILRDFHDRDLGVILKDQGVYTMLDRLTGKDLSVFFVHSGEAASLDRFNHAVVELLGLSPTSMPAIVFFKTAVGEGGEVLFEDIRMEPLDQADIIHGAHELHTVIEAYIEQLQAPLPKSGKVKGYLQAAGKFISVEVIRNLIRMAVGLA